jgi:hypothetical protein
MLPEHLAPAARHVSHIPTPESGLRSPPPREAGGATTSAGKTDLRSIRPPCWLKLARRGEAIEAWWSFDGRDWHHAGAEILPLAETLIAGLAAASPAAGDVSTFDNVHITPSPIDPSENAPHQPGDSWALAD